MTPTLDAPDQAVILVGGLGPRLGALTSDTAEAAAQYRRATVPRLSGRDLGPLRLPRYPAARRPPLREGRGLCGGGPGVIAERLFNRHHRRAGTAGAIRHGAGRFQERFLLLNGDSLLDTNWLDLMLAMPSTPLAVMALRRVRDTSRYGVVTLDGDQITGFSERGGAQVGVVNGGVYIIDRRMIAHLPESSSLE